jgi:outer membrane protein TolC
VKKTAISILLVSACSLLTDAQDRDLDFYIGQARENSPLINQANNENRIVSLDLEQMNRVLFKPEINLVSGFTFSPIVSRDHTNSGFHLASDGATDYIGHDLAITDGGQYQALVSLRQPLFSRSKYNAYVSKADISTRIIENNIALTIHELEQVVGYQYLLCTGSKKEADYTGALIKKMEEQYRLMQKLVENGIYKQTDLMLMQIELENYHQEYAMYRAEYISNLFDLNLLCGITDTAVVNLQDIDLAMGPEITAASNFLTGFMLDSLNLVSDRAIDGLKYKPRLDLFADAGLNAAYLPYPRRLGLSAGLLFTWNIFDGHQRDIQREISAINLQTLEFRKNNFMTRNEINLNKILGRLHSVKERVNLNEKQADAYKLLYDAYYKELSIGEASVMDIKNLMEDIAAKNLEVLQLKMEEQFLINTYNFLNF